MTKNHHRIVAGKKAPKVVNTPLAAPVASNANPRFTAEEAARMSQPHKPEAFLVCCIDSRFQPAKAFDYGPGVALEYRPIAAVVPPVTSADPDLMSRMAFRRLNGIDNIVMVAHSDCGGAQAALKVLQPDISSGDDLHAVSAVVHRSGLDIAARGPDLLASEMGDIKKAGNLLARELGVKSLQNLMGYKGREGYATIGDEVKAGALGVTLLFYDLEKRAFEVYDPKKGDWKHKADCAEIFVSASRAAHTCAHHHHAAPARLKT